MKLSTRSTYGMRALVELALASGHGPVSASLIASRQDLSVAYLEQLLHRLKRQGFVTSIRGPRGGYVLARSPRVITMAEVVQVLDGERPSAANGKHGKRHSTTGKNGKHPSPTETHRHAQLIAETVWRCVHDRIAESLGGVTLQDLCDTVRTEAGEPMSHRHVFHI